MAMQTMYFKEHDHNPIGQLSSAALASWWSACPVKDPNKHCWPNSHQLKHCSPSVLGESLGQLKPLSMDHPTSGDQFTAPKQGSNIGTATQFTIFPGDCKNSVDGQKPQAAISVRSVLPEYRAHFELGFGQPLICAKHPYADQCYGVFSAYGPQIPGRIMLPLNLATDDGPIYVNAKQYHGIIRRRKSRAKAELGNKSTRGRKRYMHESRHLHAMRRPRGCGGRFLNTKNSDNGKCGTEMEKAGDEQLHQPTGSQNSELQSNSGTLNSPKEANDSGPNLSGSEVTSMFCRGDLNLFPINYLKPSVHFLSDMIDTRHGIVMPSKWGVAAADNCSNLKV